MGSEGCGGAGGVSVKEAQSDRVSAVDCPKMDSSGSFSGQKEGSAWNKLVNDELCKRTNQMSSPHVEEALKNLSNAPTSSSLFLVPVPDAKQQHRKSGKVPKINGGSKRSRAHPDASLSESEADDTKGKAKDIELFPERSVVTEKNQTVKQKTNVSGKRADKRGGKAPKGKVDSFSVKNGLASFISAAGGSNILGVLGSRPDMEDVTKDVEDISLQELLDGNYMCPSSTKDKGKKSANSNILHSVREAWSILQTRKIKPQIVEIEGGYYRENIPPCLPTAGSSLASRSGGPKGDIDMTDLSSHHKVQDFGGKLKTTANILDFPVYQPKDILERLTLPPPKDLECLLLDAAKPAVAARNNSDHRLGRPSSHRGFLPPFSWSNASAGHCKSYSDSVKLSSSRSTCHGKWVKMKNPITSQETSSYFLTVLESLTYDHSLVPSELRKSVPTGNEKGPPESFSLTEQEFSSSATRAVDSQVSPESPRVLTAAQILSDMTTHSLKKNAKFHGAIKWPKRPSQKSMKAHNYKPDEKSESIFATPKVKDMYATPKSKMGSDFLVHNPVEMIPSKKLRPSVTEKNADLMHSTTILRGPLHWSMPRSSRSSPSKSFKDSVVETKHYNVNIVKKSSMLPPAARTLEAGCSSQPKPRKLMRIEWNRDGGKLE